MVELLCTDEIKRQLLRVGGGFTRIYGPDGSSLAEPIPEDQEGILYADLDLGMIPLAKAAADPSGHYSRPDVTRLMLNQTPGDRVIRFTMPGMVVAESSNARIEQAAVAAEREAASAAKKALAKH
jgi:aliphatic nitrilase